METPEPMFEKVLVANRGEIAVRVMRTCADMGIATVAVYSDADRDALHVREPDEAHRIGPAPAEASYLNAEAIIRTALRSGAQAIHPGYGFLAESGEFAEACAAAGLVFVGPSAEVLRLVGDKAAAKRLAESEGVPLVPGYHGEDQDDAVLLREAREIGFPVMIKAAKGGGGMGMRLVRDRAAFAEALEAARREARSSFGDDTLILERYLEQPRHVEVQVMGDAHGQLLNLGERECSIQRRYQKVIEESPSPGLDEVLRRDIGGAAVRLAGAAGYSNAGTVEFLVDGAGAFFFLEINARLQVEHPVTELRLGLDLVRLQLLAAAGEPLPVSQADLSPRGHAIEARVYAEDPEQGYLPGAGRLLRFEPPAGPWIRNDVGAYEGGEVPVFYNSLLGKLVVFGADRQEAVERLRNALDGYVVLGVPTNLPMLRVIAADEEFVAGRIDTDFVRRRIEPMLGPGPDLPPQALVVATVHKLVRSGLVYGASMGHEAASRDPWYAAGPWRLGRSQMEFRYDFRGQTLVATASRLPVSGGWEVCVGERVFELELHPLGDGRLQVTLDGRRQVVEAAASDEGLHVLWAGHDYLLERPESALVLDAAMGRGASDAGTTLQAPMPGRVVQVRVSQDERVTARQTLLVLEAMKMEHLISAPYDGIVRRVLCEENEQVAKGQRLLELEWV